MHVEIYLFEIIKSIQKKENVKICKMCQNVYGKIFQILMF